VLAGLHGRVFRNAAEMASTSDLEALTGELIAIVSHVANLLSFFGETLHAGQIIIVGSVTRPIWVEPGEAISFHLQPLQSISVNFAAPFRS